MSPEAPALVGCTTVASNYLAYARVLAASWRRSHPGGRFVVLLIDAGPRDGRGEAFEVLRPEDLIPDRVELQLQQAMYGPLELSTALKPRLMMRLLDEGARAVLFVDPDTDIFGSLDDLGALAHEHGVALSPHVLAPIPADGRSPSESSIQATGVFNTGLIGVGPRGRPFLDWWAARLRRHCVLDPKAGHFVDQRCVDWVPSLFPHAVIRDPGVNVAFWNLHERPLSSRGGVIEAAGAPRRHFHFSGFDPGRPGVLTAYDDAYGRPMRVILSDQPVLRGLLREYAASLLDAGFASERVRPYRLGVTAAGRPIGPWDRWVFRELVLAAEAAGGPLPPSPFDPATAAAFAAAVGETGADALPAEVRARLQVLRRLQRHASRKPPASRTGRLAWRLRERARRLIGPAGRETDLAIADWLAAVEARLERPLQAPEDLGTRLRTAVDHADA